MSLEKALEENTAALNRVADALEGGAATTAAAPQEDKPKVAPKKKVAAKKAPAKKAAPKEEPEAEAEEENIHEDPYYTDTVQPLTKKAAAALGREVVKGIIDEFGSDLKSAKDLEKDQWEDYVGRLNAELENADDLS